MSSLEELEQNNHYKPSSIKLTYGWLSRRNSRSSMLYSLFTDNVDLRNQVIKLQQKGFLFKDWTLADWMEYKFCGSKIKEVEVAYNEIKY